MHSIRKRFRDRSNLIVMQFTRKEIDLLRTACITHEQAEQSHLGSYDKLIHKLDSYSQEYDCPDCWDPSTCIVN